MNNSEDLDNPPISDVKNCLKEAGSYDPTMSEKEMIDIYHVLIHSRTTANEDEQRRIQQENDIDEFRRESVPVVYSDDNSEEYILGTIDENAPLASCSVESNEKETVTQSKQQAKMIDFEEKIASSTIKNTHKNVDNDSRSSSEESEDVIDVFDCVPKQHKPLKRITINAQYDPPFYCSKELLNKEIKERARMIFSYHLTMHRTYDDFQKQSIYPAPWGKPIQPSLRFNGSLLKKIDKYTKAKQIFQNDPYVINEKELLMSDDDFETYVSKSGRQTKRKLYTENFDDDDSGGLKRNKLSTEVENDDGEWLVKNKSAKGSTPAGGGDSKKSQPKKKRPINSLTNDEIMKRAKLFADPVVSNPSTRSEKIFDKLAEDDRKKKEVEKEIAKFNESLVQLSEDEENDENTVQDSSLDIADIVHMEEPFTRRRVVPPTHAKKPGRGRSTGRGRGRRGSKTGQESNPQQVNSAKYQPLEATSVRKSNSKKKERCPICNEEFLQCDLVEHASTCIDSYSEKSARSNPPSFCGDRITCETCDEVLPLNCDYELHVRECIVKQMKS